MTNEIKMNFNSYDNSTQNIITEGYEKKGGVNNGPKYPRPEDPIGQEGCECKWWRELEDLRALNETLMNKLVQKDEANVFFNTPIEGWSNDPCGICPHKAENEQLKEELSAIQHNCNREGCKYYDDDTFKVFYECKAQKALKLSANSITTKYCDLLQTLTEIKEMLQVIMETNKVYPLQNNLEKILQKINEVENGNS